MEENALTVLEMLLHAGHSYTRTCNRFPPKKELLFAIAQDTDMFTWGATSKVSFTKPNLHTDPLSREFYKYEGQELPDVQSLFDSRKPIFGPPPYVPVGMAYKHPSLRENPWPKPGFCPGVPMLQPKEERDREIVERFFTAIEKRFGCPVLRVLDEHGKGDGHFDRITVAMLLGTLIAAETIFDAWPHGPEYLASPGSGSSSGG